MLAVIPSATLVGATGKAVTVEVHGSTGVPRFTVVGLPDAAVRESCDRVRAALLSSGFKWPNLRLTINLAPLTVRKGGAGLDLPIAIGVLVVSGALTAAGVAGYAFVGELGLDGSLRHVPGVMSLADAAAGHQLVVPEVDAPEAALVRPGAVRGVSTLRRLADMVAGLEPWPLSPTPATHASDGEEFESGVAPPDLADVRGQRLGRRAVEVAAAGGHHLLLIGPPGSGKTMLARRLPGLLPPLTWHAALEVSRVHSAASVALPPGALILRPPFRSPHHGASAVSLVGGGTSTMRPGEISLATARVMECPLTTTAALQRDQA